MSYYVHRQVKQHGRSNFNMNSESVQVKPEWPLAIHDAIKILVNRGYLHASEDIEIVRPGHKSVIPCGEGDTKGPLKLNQLKWMAERGKFFFSWYIGSYLSLNIRKGVFTQEVIFDPTKQNAWDFVRDIDSTFQ